MNERRTIKLVRLLILLGVVVVLGGAVHLVHGWQVQRNAAGILEQSRQAEREGDYTRAADYLGQYLGLSPWDLDALVHYALMLDKQARTPKEKMRVFFLLEKVLQRDASLHEVRRHAARVAAAVGRFEDARFHLERLEQDLPTDADLLGLRARCEVAAHEYDAAADHYAKAVQMEPQRVDLAEEYAAVLHDRLGLGEIADKVIFDLVQSIPKSAPARLAAARYYLRAGSFERADQEARFAVAELGADSLEALLLAADAAVSVGKLDDASRVLQRALERYPDNGQVRRQLARLEGGTGHLKRALELLGPGLKSLPEDPEELWQLGNLLVDLKERAAAAGVLEKLQKTGPIWAAQLLRARLSASRKEWGEVRLTLEQLRPEKVPAEVARQAAILLADCYAALGSPEQQAAICRTILKTDPSWAPASLRLAGALAAMGKIDAALAQYRTLSRRASEVKVEVFRLQLAKVLALPSARRRWDEVEKAWADLSVEQKKGSEARLLRAELLAEQGKPEEARREAEAARDADPKKPGPWLTLADLTRRQDKAANVLALLDEAERRVGKRLEWEVARARHWAGVGGDEGTRRLKELAAAIKAAPADETQARLLLPLGAMYMAEGDAATARRLWRLLAETQPGNLTVRGALVEAALRGRDDAAEARTAVDQIEKVEGKDGPLGLYGRAALAVLAARAGDRQGLTDARQRLVRAAALRPSWPRPLTLLAEVEELAGRRDQALQKYQAALEQGESRLFAVQRCMQLLLEARRYTEAAALLDKVPQEARAATGLNRFQVALALADDPDADPAARRRRALAEARQVVAAGRKKYQDYLWLGQVAWIAGEPKEAEQALRQARDLADKNPETWAALILLLARTDTARAKSELATAEKQLSPEQAALALAACHEALGQTEQAAQYYQKELKRRPTDAGVLFLVANFQSRAGKTDEAEALWRRIREQESVASAGTAQAARRALALSLAAKGYPEWKQALALLDENARSGPTVEDRRVRALLLSQHPAHRAEAIRLLEELDPLAPTTPPELQFRLADLYEAEVGWPKARAFLRSLVEADSNNPLYLNVYATSLIRHSQAEEAEPSIARLARVAPDAPGTTELQARVLAATGRMAKARKLLEDYAAAKDHEERVLPTARLLEELDQADAAEKLYRRGLDDPKRPQVALTLACFLARRPRADALALYDRGWSACTPQTAAFTCLAIARGKGADDRQRRAAAERIAAIVAKDPKSVPLLLLQAEMADLCQRYSEAITAYRKVLQLIPNHAAALNNLAYMVALHQHDPAEGLRLIDAALERTGPVGELLDTRGVVYLAAAGKADRAVEDLKAAARQAPQGMTLFRLAAAQLQAQDRSGAVESFRKAVALGLKANAIHPLERKAFKSLQAELGS